MALSSRVMKWFTPSNAKRPCRAKIAPRAQLALEDLEERLVMDGADLTPYVSPLAETARNSLVGFLKTGNFDVGAMHPQLIAVGQFNPAYDNYPDLFVTNDDGAYTVLFGDGAGNFSPTAGPIVDGQQVVFSQGGPHHIEGVGTLEGVVAGDFNGDGIT